MLEWESDGNAVKKVLGEVYDKMKRPTSEEYGKRVIREVEDILPKQDQPRWWSEHHTMYIIADHIYEKYLSDSNGWDSADTVSEDHICIQYQKDTFCKECSSFVPWSFYDLSREEQEAILAPSEEDILSFAKRHPWSKK